MNFIRKNKLAFIAAFIVGIIYIAPNLFFAFSLGGDYRGIPMQFSDEYFYLARIQEILDGHLAVSSVSLFEYKNQTPLSPPVGEFLYAIPSFIFNISPVNTIILSKFFLPFILFLLVYFLVKKMTADDLLGRINAIAAGLFVALGYDLIDYRSVFSYLRGLGSPGNFLIWARPVNPILGIIFFAAFLVLIWMLIENKETKKRNFYILGVSVLLALMITSYFFSWAIALSVSSALILIYLIKKEYQAAKNLIVAVIFGFLISLPYWYFVWQAGKSPWYEYSALRSGLFYTHYPLFNKFILAVLAVFIVLILFSRAKLKSFKNWHWFSLSFIFGSLLVFSQQIITGMTIWPYHFTRYTIPLGIIVLMVLFYNTLKAKFLWKVCILVIIASLFFGVYVQVSAYLQLYPRFENLQRYVPLLDWVNQREKDCVLLVKEEPKDVPTLRGLILSFTHCNIYDFPGTGTIVPPERVYHNFLVHSLFNGGMQDARHYLFSNWKELFRVKDFPDIPDDLEGKIQAARTDYEAFLSKDLKNELSRYKLDYIIIEGEFAPKVADLIKDLDLVYTLGDIFIYRFK